MTEYARYVTCWSIATSILPGAHLSQLIFSLKPKISFQDKFTTYFDVTGSKANHLTIAL